MSSLKYEDRVKIEQFYKAGLKPIQIAMEIDRSLTTIYREFERGYTGEVDEHDRRGYSAELGQQRFMENKKRCGRRTWVKD